MSTINNSNAAALKTRHWLTRLGFVLVGIVAIVWFIVYMFVTHESKPKLATQTQAQVNVLAMTAGGDSSHVSAPPGHSVSFFGSGFTTHCVYTDGREGIVGDSKNPCASGPMLYQFVRDTTGKPNSVTYVFNKVL